MSTADRWNHNIHYHPLVLETLPAPCRQVLEVGCGEGHLARKLSDRADHVTALDRDPPTLDIARRDAAAPNITYVLADFLQHRLEPSSFDAVVSVAALHHMDAAAALARMADVLRPGGRLAVVGLARSTRPTDLAFDLCGAVATRLHKLNKSDWETSAPKIWPPPHSYREVRATAEAVLGDVEYRRLALWRYLLRWTKPSR